MLVAPLLLCAICLFPYRKRAFAFARLRAVMRGVRKLLSVGFDTAMRVIDVLLGDGWAGGLGGGKVWPPEPRGQHS